MPIDDYLPFDPDTSISPTQVDVQDILDGMGWFTWREAFHDIQDEANTDYTRPARYLTPEEALFDAFERGILSFTRLVYYEDEDKYGIYIEYDE